MNENYLQLEEDSVFSKNKAFEESESKRIRDRGTQLLFSKVYAHRTHSSLRERLKQVRELDQEE